MKPRLIAIVGPTASGKTEAALSVALQERGAVISADSRQVYTEMFIGTASPLCAVSLPEQHVYPHDPKVADTIEGVDHYLLAIRKPNQPLSLAGWQPLALDCIDSVISTERTPIVVGGTMLYVDSIIRNYTIPTVPPQDDLRAELAQRDLAELYAELVQHDPQAARYVEPHNKRRIIRALEVFKISGQPFSATRRQEPSRFNVAMFGLFPGWEVLEERLHERARQMLDDGLLAERDQLIKQYGPALPLLQTINYQEAPDIAAMVRANMRYARRQMSWWRGRSDITWLNDPVSLAAAL